MKQRLAIRLTLSAMTLLLGGYAHTIMAGPQNPIHQLLEGKSISSFPATDDPFYPAYRVAQEWGRWQANAPSDRRAIATLEELLIQKEFMGRVEQQTLTLGTLGSYKLWREALYFHLGRSYYHLKEFEKALTYYQAIDESSYLSSYALLQKSWTYFQLNKPGLARESYEKLEPRLEKELSAKQRFEWNTLKLFDLVKRKETQAAMAHYERFKGQPAYPPVKFLAMKTAAQAYFDLYVKESPQYKFSQKIPLLVKIIKLINQIPNEYRDSEFSFLASESYWLLASSYRVEDPIKYKKKVLQYLEIADSIISPWVDRSIDKQRPYLSEEAMFFSIALQWERDLQSRALVRLKNLPKLFPQGEYLEDTYQLLGDYYFEQAQFKAATFYYKKLAEMAGPQKAAYGVYKAAWSFYNLGEKWKSLRHFERLMLFYQNNDSAEFKEADKVGLYKESRRDFSTILAEMMDYRGALKELRIFNFKDEELIEYESDLAQNYQKIGKFNDGVATYKYLLKSYPEHQRNLNWLKELLETHLASGVRVAIALDLNRYYPLIKERISYSSEQFDEFQDSLGKIILTVHKEARKTDDMAIWKAVDQLYSAYRVHFSESTKGEIWYFGAQRQERLQRQWEAVEWYKQAGSIPQYELHQDAALSVLRLVKSIMDFRTLKPKLINKYAADFKKAKDYTKWFYLTYPQMDQSELAHYLYLEASFYLKEHQDAQNVIAELLQKEDTSNKKKDPHWNLFLAYNKRFYDEKNWEEAFTFTQGLLQSLEGKLKAEQEGFLRNIFQETAFLSAFEASKKTPVSPQSWTLIRERYRSAARIKADSERQIKAWANLIYSYSPTQWEALNQEVDDFEKFMVDHPALAKAHPAYLFNIYSFVAQSSEKAGRDDLKAKFLVKAARYTARPQQKVALLWEAVLLLGMYQSFSEMEQVIGFLQKLTKKELDPTQQRQVARLYFYGEQTTKAWNRIYPLVKDGRAQNATWLLFSDLVYQGAAKESDLFKGAMGFLKQRRQGLKKQAELQYLWSYVDQEAFDSSLKKWRERLGEFEPSPLSEEQALANYKKKHNKEVSSLAPDVLAVEFLKIKLQDMNQLLKELGAVKKDINEEIGEYRPQLTAQALCEAPQQTAYAIGGIKKLIKEPVASPQWPVFVKKLGQKGEELQKVYQQEQMACLEYRETLPYVLPLAQKQSLLCRFGPCPAPRALATGDLVEMERELQKKKTLDKIEAYLSAHAFGRAEYYIQGLNDQNARRLYLATLRLYLQDPPQAWQLLREISPQSKWKDNAMLLQASVELANDLPHLAYKRMKKITASKLRPFYKTYYQAVVSTLNREIKKREQQKASRGLASE